MHDIICPHCNKAFKIDEAGYADILKQVRDKDFEHQLHERLALAAQENRMRLNWLKPKSLASWKKRRALKKPKFKR